MLILAFDTAAPTVSVAVHDGERVLGEASGTGATAHGELLAPAIAHALQQAGAEMADVTDVAVGVGPGPFTGLRVGVVTALTLGSTGKTTHGVCSLDIVAAEVARDTPFLVATDARRKEVYWGLYDGAGQGGGRRIEGPAVDRPADLAALHPGIPVFGRGAELYADVLQAQAGPLDPSAAVLAAGIAAGTFVDLPVQPLYLRRPDVAQPTAPKRA